MNTNPATTLGIWLASFNMPEMKWWKYNKESVRQESKAGNLLGLAHTQLQTIQITLQYSSILVTFWGVVLTAGSMESSRKKNHTSKTQMNSQQGVHWVNK